MKKILYVLLFLPCIVFASIEVNTDIKSVIKKHLHEREGFKVQQIVQGSVTGHTSNVKVVQWTLMGASYWRNYITILDFSQNNIEIYTKQLSGVIKSISIENNLIIVKSKEKGPNDANCCPTLETTRYYKLDKTKLVEVNNPNKSLNSTPKSGAS